MACCRVVEVGGAVGCVGGGKEEDGYDEDDDLPIVEVVSVIPYGAGERGVEGRETIFANGIPAEGDGRSVPGLRFPPPQFVVCRE